MPYLPGSYKLLRHDQQADGNSRCLQLPAPLAIRWLSSLTNCFDYHIAASAVRNLEFVIIGGAWANIVQDYVERSQRPEMTPEQAVVKLLDARGILYELRVRCPFCSL